MLQYVQTEVVEDLDSHQSHFNESATGKPQIAPKLPWSQRMTNAIRMGDDAALHALMQMPDQPLNCGDQVAQWIGCTSPAQDSDGAVPSQYGEIWAFPLLGPNTESRTLQTYWDVQREQIRQSLQHWAGSKTSVALLGRPLPLSWVVAWPGSILRTVLDGFTKSDPLMKNAGPGARLVFSFDPADIDVPAELLSLAFVTLGMRSRLQSPSDILQPYQMDWHGDSGVSPGFKLDDANCLDFHCCGAPKPLRHAMVDGITQWLTAVHAQREIISWDVTLDPDEPQQIMLDITLQGGHAMRIPLNAYVFGTSAISTLLTAVAAICSKSARSSGR